MLFVYLYKDRLNRFSNLIIFRMHTKQNNLSSLTGDSFLLEIEKIKYTSIPMEILISYDVLLIIWKYQKKFF